MKKSLKITLIASAIFLAVCGGFIFWMTTLPASGKTTQKNPEYINKSELQTQKVQVSKPVQELGDGFTKTFFSFNVSALNSNPQYQLAQSDCVSYFNQYGQGDNIQFKMLDATTDSSNNYYLTYNVSGIYKGKKESFSEILTITNSSGQIILSNYSVINNG